MVSSRPRRRRRGCVANDKMLIKVLLLAASLSALSMILIPLDLAENDANGVHPYNRPSPEALDKG